MKRYILIGPETKIAHLGGRPPRVVLVLLVQQIGLFLLWAFANAPPFFSEHLALSAGRFLGHRELWQPFTALWIHLGTRSLLLNMLGLWVFGSALERWWGSRRFVVFWMVTGMIGLGIGGAAGLVQPSYILAGSAGSATAMLIAVGVLFANHLIFFYGVLPLKAKHLCLVLLAFTFLGTVLGDVFSLAEVALQLGGGAATFLFLFRGRGQKERQVIPAVERKLHILEGGKKEKKEKKLWN